MDTMPATAGTASSNPSWLPRVNRRRPFDLHWRRDPSEWGGRIASAHRYRRHVLGADTPPVMTVDDGAVAYWWCPQCGSIACPLDPSALISTDVDGKKTSLVEGRKPDAAFILQLTTEKAELERQLAEAQKSLNAADREHKRSLAEFDQVQKRLNDKENMCKMLEKERSSLVKDIGRLHAINDQLTEEISNLRNPNEKEKQTDEDDTDDQQDADAGGGGSGNGGEEEKSCDHQEELTNLRQTVAQLTAEIDRLQQDRKTTVSHGAIELEIKLATIENQLAEANEELKRWRASGRPGGMSMNRKSTVSARHSLSLTSSTIAERDQYAEEAADAGSELKLLIGSSAGGRNNSELDVTNIDELLRQAGVKLAEEQRRRQEAETEMAELRQQVDRVSSELQKARTECERLTSDLANAARASGPAIFEALNDESANGDRQLLQTPPPQPGGGSGGRGGDASRRRKEKTRSFERFVELKREIIGLRESNDKLREELAQAIAIKEDAGRRTVVIVLNRNDRRQTTPHVEVFDDDLFSDSSSTGRRTPLQLQPIRNANSKLNAATKFGGRL